MARRSPNNNQLMYLAILALLLLFAPILVSTMQNSAVRKASANYSQNAGY